MKMHVCDGLHLQGSAFERYARDIFEAHERNTEFIGFSCIALRNIECACEYDFAVRRRPRPCHSRVLSIPFSL